MNTNQDLSKRSADLQAVDFSDIQELEESLAPLVLLAGNGGCFIGCSGKNLQ